MCLFVSFALTLSLFLHLFCCFQLAVMPKHTRDVLHLGFFFFKKHTQKLWGRLLCVTSCCVSPLFFALVLSDLPSPRQLGKDTYKGGEGKAIWTSVAVIALWWSCQACLNYSKETLYKVGGILNHSRTEWVRRDNTWPEVLHLSVQFILLCFYFPVTRPQGIYCKRH